MKLDRLLQELVVSFGEFETGDAFSPHWTSPIALDGLELCSLADFPDRAVVSADPQEERGWIAPVSDPPVASAIVAFPEAAPEDHHAEFALVTSLSNTLFRGDGRHELGEALSFRGSVVAAILATHAPPDSRVLSLRLGLGSCTAHVYFLSTGKGRRWLDADEG